MLKTAVCYDGGPVAIRYPRGSGVGVSLKQRLKLIEIGKWEIMRQGSDAAILAAGSMVHPALKAAQKLSKKVVDVAVINSRYIKPLDEDMLRDAAGRYNHIITVEENVLAGGFGAAVLEFLTTERLDNVKVTLLGLPDRFVEQGPKGLLLSKLGLDDKGIVSSVLKELKR
jgi:1-deoxy-D-xylulose-5-phosphate synthase